MGRFVVGWLLPLVTAVACGGPARPVEGPAEEASRRVTLSVVGTNDLHGHVRALPVFAGYLRALRARRAADGGVVLLDGGDMFQGTLASNLLEGAPVVEAYEALGYDAVTIGNHEFDYGPVGPRPTPSEPGDDPRGALRALAAAADFPFLSANLLREADGARVDWDNVTPSTLFERSGVRVGVIGVTTEETLTTTLSANVVGLAMAPLAEAIAREASELRARGADVVLVAAHAGGRCEAFEDPFDLSSCEVDQEIFEVARRLPEGAVDVIVGGHTHRGVAHVVNGIPIIESYAYGRAFGRVDLVVEPTADRVVDVRVHPPRDLCAEGAPDDGDCVPGTYEGRPVEPDDAVAGILAPAVANARAARERSLGVRVAETIGRSRVDESALGNLFTDLMRAARPDADVALTNGGGLRADLPAGPLTYGALYQAMPFDNRFATVRLTGGQLASIVARNLRDEGSFFSLSGVRARATCQDGTLAVTLEREGGEPIGADEPLILVTTDFLATGGDGAFAALGEGAIEVEDGVPVRDAMAEALEARAGELRPDALHDPAHPRVRYPGERPVRCE
ncbi:MAG TPA: 5'-nucleotidase C-terminal domain-containing protein [Sandaracinaceae bacterium LLY-WYZ-13_1]|nr:5'-nucleotidase C-terminal domain-containing protein [Sandaracinaceae bacterium LLY-WYZ-13_1]